MTSLSRSYFSVDEQPFSKRLYQLLNQPRTAKPQKNTDYGWTQDMDITAFEDHLNGYHTLAVACVNDGLANFVAWDIDAQFVERLRIFDDVLKRRSLAGGAFATSGSSPGRGKIILTLDKRIPQMQASALAQNVLSEAVAREDFGEVRKGSLSVYPTGGDGSFVRILGCNRQRVARRILTELPLDLRWNLSDLWYVQPVRIEPEGSAGGSGLLTAVPTGASDADRQWAESFLTTPFQGTTEDLHKAQVRLAAIALRQYGDGAGDRLRQWFDEMAERNPGLKPTRMRQLVRPDLVPRLLDYVRRCWASPKPASGSARWAPLKDATIISRDIYGGTSQGKGPAPAAVRVYSALAAYVVEHHLDAHCIGMDYRRLTALAGFSDKKACSRAIQKAQDAGLLFRLDQGVPVRGSGLPTLYCLRGDGESLQEAYDLGIQTAAYAKRLADRETRGLGAPAWILVDGKAVKRDSLLAQKNACQAGILSSLESHSVRRRAA